MKHLLTLFLFCVTFQLEAQLFKAENIDYNYNSGAADLTYTITDDLCHWSNCYAQVYKLSDIEDTNLFNAANPLPGKWQNFVFVDIAHVDTSLLDYQRVVLYDQLYKIGTNHYYRDIDLSYYDIYKPITEITSVRYDNFFFKEDGIGSITIEGGTGTLTYNGNHAIFDVYTDEIDVNSILFIYELEYALNNKAMISFDVPKGYWVFFLKSKVNPNYTAKIPIYNPGRNSIIII